MTDHLPNSMCYAWSEVLPAVLMCIQGFWNVTVQEERLLYADNESTVLLWNVRNHTASNRVSTVSHPRRLESSSNIALYYFMHDRLWLSRTRKMEAAGTAATLALTRQTAQHDPPEDSNTHSLCCENLTRQQYTQSLLWEPHTSHNLCSIIKSQNQLHTKHHTHNDTLL